MIPLRMLHILMILNGSVINANNFEIMNNKESFQSFDIGYKCINSKRQRIKAIMS